MWIQDSNCGVASAIDNVGVHEVFAIEHVDENKTTPESGDYTGVMSW